MTLHLRRRLILVSLALLAGWTFLAPGVASGSTQGQDRPEVGVVDVDRVLRESALVKSIEEQARTYSNTVQARLQTLQQERQQLSDQLQELAAESERAREIRQVLILKNAEFEGLRAARERELAIISAAGRLRALNALKDAVLKVAQERQLRLVVQKAPPLPASLPPTYEPGNAAQERALQELIDRQIALYSAPEADITSEVLLRMDETFRAGGGVVPPTTRPATGEAEGQPGN
jgi:Skp family chaperone for outer membrane proteins